MKIGSIILKIAVINPITKTGEGTYSKYLIEGLIKKGIDVDIIENPFLKRPNIKIFLGSFLLKRLIKNKEISILHNLDNLGPFLIKQNYNNLKTIQTVFDISPVVLPEIHQGMLKFDFKYVLPKLIKNADSVIVSSYSTKKDLIHNFDVDKRKIDIIPLGIDKSIFYPRKNNENVLKKYGIKNKYLLYTGNENPRKNLKNLILAYGKIFKEINDDLVLVGPINPENIMNIINRSSGLSNYKEDLFKRIKITGYVESNDLPAIYSEASAYVYPSLYEGFGFPPLEAMACGTPVITSNNSSLKEVVNNAGLYINDPTNPEDISESIMNLTSNDKLQKKLKENGFKQANKYNWQKTVDETVRVYERIMD